MKNCSIFNKFLIVVKGYCDIPIVLLSLIFSLLFNKIKIIIIGLSCTANTNRFVKTQ